MAYPVEIWPDSLPESIFGVAMMRLQNWLSACDLPCSPIAAHSHQVWGLLLTRFTLVHASIFRKICCCVGQSVSRWCRGASTTIFGEPAIAGWSVPQSTFILVPRCPHDLFPGAADSLWRRRRGGWWGGWWGVGVVRCWGGGAVLWNGCGVVWWCWSVIRSVF